MPTKTTKTSPNGAKKKPQANKLPKFGDQVLELLRERLSAIETNVGLTHAAVLALQESSAKPADPPPAEKWVVGEWVEVTGECGKGGSRRLVGVVGQLECKWPNEFLNPAWIIKGTGSWFAQKNLRLLSPAEIAEHKMKEEARMKAEAEARELAMPLEFGTRVKVKGREEENWRIACDEPTDDGYWRLAPPKCGNLNTMTAKRSEFTIIP